MSINKASLLAGAAIIALSAGAAFAADLPTRRAPAPAPYVAVPVFTWTGFYVGVNAGYGFSDNNRDNHYGSTPYYGSTAYYGSNDSGRDGFVGGGQIGYNYQIGQWVIGVEADAQFADLGRKNDYVYGTSTTYGYGYGYGHGNQGIDWFGTVRGRLGYAMDRVMIYGTGGFAFGGGDNNDNHYATTGYYYGNRDKTRTGWAAGGGVEYAFTPNLTGKIEGLFVNLERDRNDYYGTTTTGYGYGYGHGRNNEDSFAVVRAGLNYKFTSY
jgi:outer membrane immunogenic protein